MKLLEINFQINLILMIMLLITAIGIAIFVGSFAKRVDKREAMLNEYEYVLADVWAEKEKFRAEKEDCIDQLGVFYKK